MDTHLFATAREALWLAALVASPPVVAAIVVGLAVGVAQAVTQVQDQALSLGLRVLAVSATLAITGGWLATQLITFTDAVLRSAGR